MNLLEEKLSQFDPAVDGIIRDEMRRNEETINLIASENYPPKSLMKAISSMLSGIYSEGYPGERWYREGMAVRAMSKSDVRARGRRSGWRCRNSR